ncbi:PREDICTED: uncharacterized protein LOC105565045 [Vollenhovia emeryi]|uniref:uncharacterized protein LOC105565045 n=1 Tax=Vollenhovia emeryi TaxID=411798 RepID=UPI0005F48488|nr:PREDICTED: uncharacterized protein LOC105565045 [Vollenhovia emeryi]
MTPNNHILSWSGEEEDTRERACNGEEEEEEEERRAAADARTRTPEHRDALPVRLAEWLVHVRVTISSSAAAAVTLGRVAQAPSSRVGALTAPRSKCRMSDASEATLKIPECQWTITITMSAQHGDLIEAGTTVHVAPHS